MSVVFYETRVTIAEASMPIWRSDRTAAMAPIQLMAGPEQFADFTRLDPQIEAAANMLKSLPFELTCLQIGWLLNYACTHDTGTGWGDYRYVTDWSKPINTATDEAICAYIATSLKQHGVNRIRLLFVDHEAAARYYPSGGPDESARFTANLLRYHKDKITGRPLSNTDPDDLTIRRRAMRAATTPIKRLFPEIERLNYTWGQPSSVIPTIDAWGHPIGSAVVDDSSDVDCYACKRVPAESNARTGPAGTRHRSWVQHRQNVRSCVRLGPTYPHGPALFTKDNGEVIRPIGEAIRDTRDAIIADTVSGAAGHIIATYMWPPEQWPTLAETCSDALALVEGV